MLRWPTCHKGERLLCVGEASLVREEQVCVLGFLDSFFFIFLLSKRIGWREGKKEREENGRGRSNELRDNFNFPPVQKERGNRTTFSTSMLLCCDIDFLRYSCCDLFNSFSPLILIKFVSCLQAWGTGTKHETLRAKCFSFAIEFSWVLKVLHRREWKWNPEAEAFPLLHQSQNNKHKN